MFADGDIDDAVTFADEGDLQTVKSADHCFGITDLRILLQIKIADIGPRLKLE